MDTSSHRARRDRPAYGSVSPSDPQQRMEGEQAFGEHRSFGEHKAFGEQRSFGERKTVAEYQRMLAYQTVEQLRTIAQQRGITLQAVRKESIVAELAARLSDPAATRAVLEGLSEAERQTLVHLHLALAPEYGLGVESVLRELVRQDRDSSRRTLYKQCISLSQKGLLLPFRQNNALYYALPNVVRANLPIQPDLVPAYPEDKIGELAVHEIEIGPVIQTLFAIWTSVADRAVSEEGPGFTAQADRRQTNEETPTGEGTRDRRTPKSALRRQALPRRPIEDEWPHLQEWAHVPTEIEELERQQRYRRRSSAPGGSRPTWTEARTDGVSPTRPARRSGWSACTPAWGCSPPASTPSTTSSSSATPTTSPRI